MWHDGTLGKNNSKAVKSLLTSSLLGKYDVIKQLSVLFQVEIRAPLSLIKLSKGVNIEALISNLKEKIRYEDFCMIN